MKNPNVMTHDQYRAAVGIGTVRPIVDPFAEEARRLKPGQRTGGPTILLRDVPTVDAVAEARPRMNKTEQRYADHLEAQVRAGTVKTFGFECITFKLAHDCRYTPDFYVERPDGSQEMHEIKGFWRDDARVKIRVAAERFKLFKFIAVRAVPKAKGGGWAVERFGP